MTTDTLRTSQMFEDFDTIKDCFEVNRVKDMITLPVVFEARLPAFRPVLPQLQSREEVYLREKMPFEVTLNFGAANTDEVVALVPFTSIIKVVFAQMFGIDVSMITVSFVEVTSASAFVIAFSATRSGLSMSTISVSSTQMTGTVQPGVREQRSQLHRLFCERQRCRGLFCDVGIGSCQSRGGRGTFSLWNWPQHANVIGDIRDQSGCDCCWTSADTEVASNRMCITSNAALLMHLSAHARLCDSYDGYNGGQIDTPPGTTSCHTAR